MSLEPELRTIASRADWWDPEHGKPIGWNVPNGEAVICGYPTSCSVCGDKHGDYPAGQVILAAITRRPNPDHLRKPDWRGWWSCTGPGTEEHWLRGKPHQRLIETGSVTP